MSEIPPKPTRTTGLSPKEQKLQALRAKLANAKTGAKPSTLSPAPNSLKATSAGFKKTSFQRKAT